MVVSSDLVHAVVQCSRASHFKLLEPGGEPDGAALAALAGQRRVHMRVDAVGVRRSEDDGRAALYLTAEAIEQEHPV